MPRLLFLFYITLFTLILSSFDTKANPSASALVNTTHQVYIALDIFTAQDLLLRRIHGQKPYTRSEVARLLSEANKTLDDKTKSIVEKSKKWRYIKNLLNSFITEFQANLSAIDHPPHEIKLHPLERGKLQLTGLNRQTRSYFGLPSGQYDPLVQNQEGRHYNNGLQIAAETEHRLQGGSLFSAFLKPRLQLQAQEDGEQAAFLQEGYVSFAMWNHQIDAGRKPLAWGQAAQGGLLLSNNTRPLDGLQIYNISPWRASFLGEIKYSFFLNTLGPEQTFKNPLFSGFKFTASPHPLFEIGVSRALIFGGQNAPNASFGDYILEYFGVRPGDINVVNLSNSIQGFETRVRLPFLRNLEIYGEFYFDDFDFVDIHKSFTQDGGMLFGAYLARLDDKGSWNLRVEGRKTASILYKHSIWTTGWTQNGLVLGDPLGPDADSLSVFLHKMSNDLLTQISWMGTLERVDSDIYFGGGAAVGRIKTTDGPPELRFRTTFSASRALSNLCTLSGSLGYERIKDFNFTRGDDENGFLAQVSLDFRPHLPAWNSR